MLEYNVHIDGTESIDLHGEFGQFTLLIDNFTPCHYCSTR